MGPWPWVGSGGEGERLGEGREGRVGAEGGVAGAGVAG